MNWIENLHIFNFFLARLSNNTAETAISSGGRSRVHFDWPEQLVCHKNCQDHTITTGAGQWAELAWWGGTTKSDWPQQGRYRCNTLILGHCLIRTNLICTISLAHWILNLLVIILLNTYTGSLILIDLSVGSYSIRNLTLVSVEYVKMKKTIGHLWIKNVSCESIDQE